MLTIVIPVYNEEDHLKACLDSIAKQTVKPKEVIIVDNNSTDRSVQIARSYPFTRIITEEKQGICYARNKGFDAVKDGIIGRIDADSRLPANWVHYMTEYISTHPNHLLSGGSYFYDAKIPHFFGWIQSQLAFRVNRMIMGHYIAWGSNMAFTRDAWNVVKKEVHNDPTIHEDMDLSIHLREHGYEITYHAGLKVGIDSRVFSSRRETRQQQLSYLMMWPRTLYAHSMKRAWLGWVGAHIVYFSYIPILIADKIGGLLKKNH